MLGPARSSSGARRGDAGFRRARRNRWGAPGKWRSCRGPGRALRFLDSPCDPLPAPRQAGGDPRESTHAHRRRHRLLDRRRPRRENDRPASERLFEDPYAAIFAAAGAHAREGTERYLALPFFRDGVRLRTRFIDDAVRGGLEAGLDQVVILGAGFDCRGLRMPEIAERGAAVYECRLRRAARAETRASSAPRAWRCPPRMAHVPCDFAAPDFEGALTASLAESGFRAGAGAIFVWEGVIGYIDEATVDRSLAFMAGAGGPGTRLVLTFGYGVELTLERARRAGFTTMEEHGCDALCGAYLTASRTRTRGWRGSAWRSCSRRGGTVPGDAGAWITARIPRRRTGGRPPCRRGSRRGGSCRPAIGSICCRSSRW